MKYPQLQTERFTLKVLTPDLVGEDYLSWFSSPKTSEFISYAKNEVTLQGLKNYAQEKLENPNVLFLGIFLNESLLHIGNIKFEPISFEEGHAVLGILIGNEDWRGRGVFSEISKIIEESFKDKGIKNIYLGVEKGNQSAINAYLKSGYIIDESNYLKINLDLGVCMLKKIQ